MRRTFGNRLTALEQWIPTGEAGRIFLVYLDEGRYLIDGIEVEAGEWHERSLMAGASSYRIEVAYEDMEAVPR